MFGAARTLDKAKAACAPLGSAAVPLACELSEPESIRDCATELSALGVELDVVLCNAGIMALPERTIVGEQELQFRTNHLGHFQLVLSVRKLLSKTARIVVLSSAAHRWATSEGIQFEDLTLANNYTPRIAYGQSKLANLLFARTLSAQFSGTRQTVNAVHPGVIATNLLRHAPSAVQLGLPVASAVALKTVEQGASTQLFVGVHPLAARRNGEYFADCSVAKTSRAGRDLQMAERLWRVSEEIVPSF